MNHRTAGAAWGRLIGHGTSPILLAILFVNLGLLTAYITFGYRLDINSDAATKLVLAEEIRHTGSFFPADFYVGRDLWILQGHLTVLALAPFLGTGFAAHAASGIVLVSLLLFSFTSLLRRLDLPPDVVVITLIFVTAGFSPEWAEHMYGQGSYGYVCLLLIWAMIAAYDAFVARRPGVWPIAALAAVGLLVGLNGVRGIVTEVVPVSAGVVVATSVAGLPRRRVVVGSVAFFAGLGLNAAVEARSAMATVPNTINSLDAFVWANGFPALVQLFGLVPEGRVDSASASMLAVYALRAAIFGMLSLGGATAVVLLITRRASAAARYVTVTAIVLTAATIYAMFMFKALSGIARYLIPSVFVGIAAAATALHVYRARIRPLVFTFVGCVLLVLSWTTYVQPALQAARERGVERMHPLTPLVKALEERSITRGYATFWNSGVVTALSPRVRLRQIELRDGGVPVPYLYLAAAHWYAETGRTALVLRVADEAPRFEQALAAGRIAAADHVAVVGDFRVYEYETNVFAELPQWRRLRLHSE